MTNDYETRTSRCLPEMKKAMIEVTGLSERRLKRVIAINLPNPRKMSLETVR